ncbi:helix-turn-helix domain-containing protein [Streptomyces sp. NBC_00343]|uniref:helix-turn-helix domain-containing protein n=1 Tax=Streptomyces sp. NBC_00343 TaxID=2975719 RepID=UPI002E2D0AFE|nr:helix-turn-helix transcriptional regulator [Streptomyces sp. NBC_00343]
MCRPEKPITTDNTALRELAEWLRDQRERTRHGYRALSARAGCHATTLQRAASGDGVPRLQTVLNYARACDASPEEARRLWKQARYEEVRLARGGRVPVPRPELIRDFVDLSAALQDLYEKSGSPSLRTMEQRAGNYGVLPRSTAHRIVTKQAMPHSLRQFQAYLQACEVPETEWPGWEAAWTRAWRHEKRDDFAALGTAPTPLRDVLDAAGILYVDEGDVVVQDSTGRTYARTSTKTQVLRERMRDCLPDAHGEGVRHSLLRLPPGQVKHREPVSSRRHTGPARRQLPERAGQGRLDFGDLETVVEPGLLF